MSTPSTYAASSFALTSGPREASPAGPRSWHSAGSFEQARVPGSPESFRGRDRTCRPLVRATTVPTMSVRRAQVGDGRPFASGCPSPAPSAPPVASPVFRQADTFDDTRPPGRSGLRAHATTRPDTADSSAAGSSYSVVTVQVPIAFVPAPRRPTWPGAQRPSEERPVGPAARPMGQGATLRPATAQAAGAPRAAIAPFGPPAPRRMGPAQPQDSGRNAFELAGDLELLELDEGLLPPPEEPTTSPALPAAWRFAGLRPGLEMPPARPATPPSPLRFTRRWLRAAAQPEQHRGLDVVGLRHAARRGSAGAASSRGAAGESDGLFGYGVDAK